MTREEWRKIRAIFERALELEPEQRAAYLDDACAGDAAARAEVESLLAADQQATGSFLTGPAVAAAGLAAEPEEREVLAGRRIGPYQIVEEIGRGGMGMVYRAVRADDQFRQQVAIKIVRGGLTDALAIQRFKAERQILANLEHPHIARLLDGGATGDGSPYVVMEYVAGRPIDEYAGAHKLPLRERLDLFRTVCSAVAYAHQRLVIHRDIKPANILVTEAGEPKLLDFGIAKILDADPAAGQEQTVTLVRLMTPEYASPEQVRGEPVTTATDVYSLGVVLYGLLTGRRPYRVATRTPHEIAKAVLEAEPEKPSTAVTRDAEGGAPPSRARYASPEKLRRRLRGDLDNIVLKALRKEPERRYASVEQFSEDIRRHLAGLPVSARPDTLLYRSGKFVRRHKVAVAAALAAVLALMGGMAATLREAYIAGQERQRAEQRFNDVRQLANSLLFDVHDAIQNLPGATPARKLLVERALQYLDKLAREAKGDLSLQRELAAAYEKVGDVQGGFRASNLGDTAGAIASYRKALAIREAVAHARPADAQAQRELIRTHGLLSDALMAAGDPAGSIDQLRQLLPIAARLADADPHNLANRRNLALAYLDYGWKRARQGDWQSGLEDCRKSVGMLETLAAADPGDKRLQRVLVLAYGRVGDLLAAYAHQDAESLAMHRQALEHAQALLAADARNTDYRRIEAWERLRAADEMGAQGERRAALAGYRGALERLRALSAADPASVQFHGDVAAAWGRLGTAHLGLGDTRAALAELRNSLAEIDASKSGPADNDAWETQAAGQFRMGQAYTALAENPQSPAAGRAEDWRQAQTWFERSLPTLAEAQKRGALEADETGMLAQAQQEIARCTRELDRLTAANRR